MAKSKPEPSLETLGIADCSRARKNTTKLHRRFYKITNLEQFDSLINLRLRVSRQSIIIINHARQMTARNWLCTLNNPVASDMGLYLKELHELTGAVYTVGQLEKGLKEGTPHLQFTMNFPRQVRMAHITKVVQCHCVAIKVDNGVDTYCMKEETRVDGPWTFGQRPIKNTKTDWKIVWDLAVANRIDEIPTRFV